MKYTLFASLLLVLVSSFVLADAFHYEAGAVRSVVLPGSPVVFNLSITNLQSSTDVVSFSPVESTNWITTPSSVSVLPQETKVVTLTITPAQVFVGSFTVDIDAHSRNTREISRISLFTRFTTSSPAQSYVKNVGVVVATDEVYDPREQVKVRFSLTNRNPILIDPVRIVVLSDGLFEDEFTISLDPLEQEDINRYYVIDPLQAPGEHELIVNVFLDNESVAYKSVQKLFSVEEYGDISFTLTTEKDGLLSRRLVEVFTNTGNIPLEKTFMIPVGGFRKYFSSTDPSYKVVKDLNGNNYYEVGVSLAPNTSTEVVFTENFWPLVSTILVIIVSIVAYFVFRPQVVIRKSYSTLGDNEKDGTQVLRVRLIVRNRSRTPVSNLSVFDKAPHIVDISVDDKPGVLMPTKITKNDKRGAIVKWDIDLFDGFEERILVYKLKTKLNVIGDMTLPRAKAKFVSKFGAQTTVQSKRVF
ncbi:MAG: hypothetical protein H6502_03905 [Candidatus Woesearchaeota archaeon]|nr:MAG: hypothetical protein H6502_03905 [Candidatus Woesearchaeota archaeon]